MDAELLRCLRKEGHLHRMVNRHQNRHRKYDVFVSY
jgi:hypothetical protein